MPVIQYLRAIAIVSLFFSNTLINHAWSGTNTELLVVEESGCVYCAKFNREIAPAYAKTEEGQRAPLRRVQRDAPWPVDLNTVDKPRFTPTFILMSNGVEIDRLEGYPGDEHFWFLLGQMLNKL